MSDSPPQTPQTATQINAPQIGEVRLTPTPATKPIAMSKPVAPAPFRGPLAARQPRKMQPPGNRHLHAGTVGTVQEVIAEINANWTLPQETKTYIASVVMARNHKYCKVDAHGFDNDGDWTLTAHVKKVA
jgi:hypothetical protein